MNIHVRKATELDVPRLRELIEASVRSLQADNYSPAQIEGALRSVYGVDSQLIADGTYLVAEVVESEEGSPEIVGCGGWSTRKTLYGGDQCAGREDSRLDPARDAAKIRAFFTHPKWTRRGIAALILEACEKAAREAGFTRLEMGATLSGVAFYQAQGYVSLENLEVRLGNGEVLPIVRWQSDSADSLEQTRSVFELARTTQSLRARQGTARPGDYSYTHHFREAAAVERTLDSQILYSSSRRASTYAFASSKLL